mmetsp:Transcript_56175/g.68707  ORF Transcript_56175/g.68707 Transcript_56175/m.68707 type:complete len:251 (-) Transcript_56175:106-858(-)
MSRQVLKDRELIATKIGKLSETISNGIEAVTEINDQKDWVKKNQKLINNNQERPYISSKKAWRKKLTNNTVITTCTVCKFKSCHPNCCVSDKSSCSVMVDGKCEICGCPYFLHENVNYVWEQYKIPIKKTNWDDEPERKKTYNEAKEAKTRAERILNNCDRKLKKIEEFVQNCVVVIQSAINSLSERALCKHVAITKDYIENLIIVETDECKPGWEERVKVLKKMAKEADYTEAIQHNTFSFKDAMGMKY